MTLGEVIVIGVLLAIVGLYMHWGQVRQSLLPKKSKWVSGGIHVDEALQRCPWKEDITIERSSFMGSGNFGTIPGQEYHTVYCSASGPNHDGTGSFHRAWLGYWGDFKSFKEANDFAWELWRKIRDLLGREVPIYASKQDKNDHASWCLGERDEQPAGIHPWELPTDFADYSYEDVEND